MRRVRTRLSVFGKSNYLTYGKDLHIGKGSRLWAPDFLEVGDSVYIGKDVHIECNCAIGDYCLIANRVAFVGRHDHDFKAVGYPVRYSPWIGSEAMIASNYRKEKVDVGQDVWIGYGAIILTGVTVGRGAVVSAGSLVVKDVPEYAIVAGTPARVIGKRFSAEEIHEHEQMISSGKFVLSERGLDHCVVRVGHGD